MSNRLFPDIKHHDLHVHTTLSRCCTDDLCTPALILERAASSGIEIIGFSNHFWDEACPLPSDWYKEQDRAHLLSLKNSIPEDTHGVEVWFGCETEFCGGSRIGISREMAERLDYVLVPASHFHMTGFTVETWQVSTPKKVAELLVERFQEASSLAYVTGIAHPFLPLGFIDQLDEISQYISDQALQDCFGMAAENNISIEIQPGMLPGCDGREEEAFHDESMLRILQVAVEMGCLCNLVPNRKHRKTLSLPTAVRSR